MTVQDKMYKVKPKYYQEAERLLGIKEIKGKEHNEEILSLWEDSEIPGGATTDETPWCAAFVNGCLVRGNKAGTKSGLARSFLWDENTDKFEKLKKPEKYAIAVMKRGNSTWQGHVGFVKDFDKDYVYLLGGNQGDSVSVSRFPRAAFNGAGLGFVKPKEKSTDVEIKDLKKDSRQLRVTGWLEKLQLSLAAAAASTWVFFQDAYQYVQSNAGAFILGGVLLAFFSYKAISAYTINAYREGRYLPKAHE